MKTIEKHEEVNLHISKRLAGILLVLLIASVILFAGYQNRNWLPKGMTIEKGSDAEQTINALQLIVVCIILMLAEIGIALMTNRINGLLASLFGGLLAGLLFGLFGGLFGGLLVGLLFGLFGGLLAGLLAGLLVGLLVGLLAGLLAGLLGEEDKN